MTEEQFEDHAGGHVSEEPAEGDAVAELVAESSDAPAEPVTTGVKVVDDVLGTLEGLDESSVEEHLPIYEAAHEQLRGALDGDAEADADDADAGDDQQSD